MCAALAGVLYLLARRILYASPIVALVSSATASAYPALATQAGIAWAEITAMLGIAVFVLTAWHLCRYPGYSPMLYCAAVAVFLSFVHSRFVALPVLFLGLLAYIAFSRRDLRLSALLSAVALVAVWLVMQVTQMAVYKARWNAGGPRPDASLHEVMQAIPLRLLRSVSGQMWYLLVGTVGLVVLGLAGLIRGFLRQTSEDAAALRRPPLPGALVLAYVLLGMCSVFVVSSVFAATRIALVRTAPRLDLIALGRYDDALVPTLIALGIAGLLVGIPRRGSTKVLAIAAIATLLVGLLSVALGGITDSNGDQSCYRSGCFPFLYLSRTRICIRTLQCCW